MANGSNLARENGAWSSTASTAPPKSQTPRLEESQTSKKKQKNTPKQQHPTILKKENPTANDAAKSIAPKTESVNTRRDDNAPSGSGKKKRKNKPHLTTVSIGDMIPGAKKTGVAKQKSGNQTQQMQHSQPNPQSKSIAPRLQVDSIQDFPTLGASTKLSTAPAAATPTVRSAAASAATPTHKTLAWGVKAPPAAATPSKAPKRGKEVPSANSGTKKASTKKGKKASATATKSNEPSSIQLASSFFTPVARSGDGQNAGMDGDEHKLLRLMQERTVYQKKGRQRVAQRKKKFTALKKKVLQERLDQWRKLNPSPDDSKDGTNLTFDSVCVYHYTSLEEVEDDDEYEEILENLTNMARKVGPVAKIFLPRVVVASPGEDDGGDSENVVTEPNHPAFIRFENPNDAAAALATWNGLVVAGNTLKVLALDIPTLTEETTDSWSDQALAAEIANQKVRTLDNDNNATGPMEILLLNVLTDDDFEDEDCMSESLADLRKVAEKFGDVQSICSADEKDGNVVLTYTCPLSTAREIAESLCRNVVGGKPLYAVVRESPVPPSTSSSATIILENVLTQVDLEDEECLAETLNDVREIALRYGEVSNITVKGNGVKVTYTGGSSLAKIAIDDLNGLILGGNVIAASLVVDEMNGSDGDENSIILRNVLSDEDLEDEDCLQESLNDIRELASKYGLVSSVETLKMNDSVSVRIKFDGSGPSVPTEAVKGLDGAVIGGQIISASLPGQESQKNSTSTPPTMQTAESLGGKRKQQDETFTAATDKKARTDTKEPLYSGDKLIPERFAEMKRVPKVATTAGPRDYSSTINDDRVKPLLVEMLGELSRLQKRAMEDKNTKARRRLVFGLREVARGIRSHKVKMVVMANNLDQYGAIDEKLQEIINLAKAEGVPIFYEFTKRTLGKAIGKSIKIAVVGIQNADGAHQPFKKLNSIAG